MAEIQQTITPKEPKQPPKTVLDDEIGDFEPEQPELLGPSPIPEARPVEIPKNTPLNELMDILKKWLYIEEDYAITGPLCVAIANFCQGDTDIVGIVGPSGSIKTEVIRALGTTENEIVYPISSLTEHTFISGFSEKSDIDVVPNLRGS